MSSPKSDSSPGLKEKKSKNPPWAPTEHDTLYQSLRELRDYEKINAVRSPLRDTKLWTTMSEKLQSHNIIRTPNSCKTYWSRYGRSSTQFDERAEPKPDMLATCVQRTKVNLTQTTPKNSPSIGADLSNFQARPEATSQAGTVDAGVSDDPEQGQDQDNLAMAPRQKPPAVAKKPVRAKTNKTLNLLQSNRATIVTKRRTRARKEVSTSQRLIDNDSTSNPVFPLEAPQAALTVAELRARAVLVQWTPEQLEHLEAESVKSKGEIPFEEQYSWLSQKLGWRIKYQDIKDWFVVNAAALAFQNRPNETNDDFHLDNREYNAPSMGGLLASVPYFPVDPKTVIPENVVKYFQSLSHDEGVGEAAVMEMGNGNDNDNTTQKKGFQLFTGNVGLGITSSNAAPRLLTQEESMNCFRQRYPIFPKPYRQSLTIKLHNKGGIQKKCPQQQYKTEAPQSLNNTQRFRGSHAQATTSSTGQPSPSIPTSEDSKIRESLERRVKFEEVSLAEIERLMEGSVGFSPWHQHLSEKAANSRGKIQAYEGVLNALAV